MYSVKLAAEERKIFEPLFKSLLMGVINTFSKFNHRLIPKYEATGCSLNIVFFFQEFSEVCHLSLASIRLLLVVQKMTSQRSNCTPHCVESFEGHLQHYRRGRGCSEL